MAFKIINPLHKLLSFSGVLLLTTSTYLAVFSAHAQQVRAASVPFVSISNASVLEGDSGTRTMNFVISLSEPSATNVTLNYTTNNWVNDNSATGVATATTVGGDYVYKYKRPLTFLPGQTQKVVPVTIIGDTALEYDEQFSVDLSDVVGAQVMDGSGTGTVINDDSASGFRLGIGDASIRTSKTNDLNVQLTVSFSSPAPSNFSLTAKTISGTATGVATATTAGGDFVNKTVNLGVLAGQSQKVITFTIKPNATVESTKYFTVQLTSTLGAVTKSTATVQIRDPNATYNNRAGRRPGPPRVTLVGDSVTANYQETAKAIFESWGFQVSKYGIPATSILDADKCDGQQANAILNNEDPDFVVYENIGNYFYTPCSPVLAYDSPELFAKWQQVAQLDTNILTSKGAKFYWIINPSVPAADAGRYDMIQHINPIYAQIASSTANTHTIDAWAPFGGDPPDCSLRELADPEPCLHLKPNGQLLMAYLVSTAVGTP